MSLLFTSSRWVVAVLAVSAGQTASAQVLASAVAGDASSASKATLAAAAADADPPQTVDEVIVTGTRATGITAAQSAAPIKLLDAETLSHVGQPALNQVLSQLVPSFTAQAFGGDTANLTLSARLRGLSPNHALVLVNGKRRHGTANLAVVGGPYQGAATADLDLISPSSVKRIEVLEDGAAAQYGSDAIAGVINIILKDDNSGGDGYVTAGRYYGTGGDTLAGTLHLATKLGEAGFVNLTGFYRFHDFSQVGGLDRRVVDPSGALLSTLSAAQKTLYATIPGLPNVNRIFGDARSWLTNVQFSAGYDFGGVEAYSFGTYSRRIASAYENLRVPDRVIASPVLGVRGTLATPGELIFAPSGFNPREGIREEDYAITGGVRGTLAGFHYDLSTTFGQDENKIYTLDSANASLFVDTHFTPVDFYDGSFKATELTLNADFTRELELGLSSPLVFAFGAEFRRNTYRIGAGDPASIYKEGGQSYPGFRPSDARFHERKNTALYADVALTPMEGLKLDGAVRYEHYTGFGDQVIGKLTGRYDFSPAFALRGTVSNGFRAPTLAESYYSATNVSPTAAFVQLPANSAAAKLLGFADLKPEKSTNFSVGTVIRPASRLVVTLDAYQVRITNRILGTGSLYGSGGAVNFPIVTQAIVANGNVLDPTVSQTGINIFTNGADTRTRGVDLVVSYHTGFGNYGNANWSLTGNYNETKITRLGRAPATLTPSGGTVPVALFDVGAQSNLETASPRVKMIGNVLYSLDRFSANLRGTVYGSTSAYTSPDGGTYYNQRIGTAFIGDVELSYKFADLIQLSLGANNILDKRPPTVRIVPGSSGPPFTLINGGNVYASPYTFSPYGINGGYYYARLNLTF